MLAADGQQGQDLDDPSSIAGGQIFHRHGRQRQPLQPDPVVVLCTAEAERHAQPWSSPEVHIWGVAGNQTMDFREFHGDQQAEDELWSSWGANPVKSNYSRELIPGAPSRSSSVCLDGGTHPGGSAHSAYRRW
jgi:hypothetical protein